MKRYFHRVGTLLLALSFMIGLFAATTTVSAGAGVPWTKCSIAISGADPGMPATLTIGGKTINATSNANGKIVFKLPNGDYNNTPAMVSFVVGGQQITDTYLVTATCGTGGGGVEPHPWPYPPDGRINPNRAALYFYYCQEDKLEIWYYDPKTEQGQMVGSLSYWTISEELFLSTISNRERDISREIYWPNKEHENAVGMTVHPTGLISLVAQGQHGKWDNFSFAPWGSACPQFSALERKYMNDIQTDPSLPAGVTAPENTKQYVLGNGVKITVSSVAWKGLIEEDLHAVWLDYGEGAPVVNVLSPSQYENLTAALENKSN